MTQADIPARIVAAPTRRTTGVLDRLRASRFNFWFTLALALIIAAPVAVYFSYSEGSGANLVWVSSITLAIVCALATLTRRLVLSTLLTAAMIGLVVTVATAKRAADKMAAHAYDLYFYFPTPALLQSLWESHPAFLLAVIAGCAATIVLAILVWRIERPFRMRLWPLAALVVFAASATLAGREKIERRHMQFYWNDLFVSSFYASWGDTLQVLARGQMLESARASQAPPFIAGAACAPGEKPPHILLIHEESVVQPGLFPQLSYDRRLDDFFKSFDGQTHQLRVETYGGASWLTEFSLMTGLSTQSFGGIRGFLQTYLVNRLQDTLPQALTRCGYRNALFYPMLKTFASAAPFFRTVGISDIFDARDQKAPTAFERDRFYFGNALADLGRHIEASRQPLFTYIETMATHWPYDFKAFPEENAPGGGPGVDAELSEYLRRLWLAKTDYEDLRRQLRARFPNERFLIVHYGDHQPVATRKLLGFLEEMEAEDIILPPDSPGFVTYFTVDGVNYAPPPLPAVPTTDVAFLPALILYAARLPLPDSYAERLRLMRACGGKYYDCPDRAAILDFHRRLIDAGLLSPK